MASNGAKAASGRRLKSRSAVRKATLAASSFVLLVISGLCLAFVLLNRAAHRLPGAQLTTQVLLGCLGVGLALVGFASVARTRSERPKDWRLTWWFAVGQVLLAVFEVWSLVGFMSGPFQVS